MPHNQLLVPGQPLSSRRWQTGGMKNVELEPQIVARFGQADLVRIDGADYQLHNASTDDCTAAKEWVSLFMHEAVIAGLMNHGLQPGAA